MYEVINNNYTCLVYTSIIIIKLKIILYCYGDGYWMLISVAEFARVDDQCWTGCCVSFFYIK